MQTEYTDGYFNVSKKYGFLPMYSCLNDINLKFEDNKNYSNIFKVATKQALNDFKGKKIRIGRARMFEDKTKDLDDPGMLALNRLTEVF